MGLREDEYCDPLVLYEANKGVKQKLKPNQCRILEYEKIKNPIQVKQCEKVTFNVVNEQKPNSEEIILIKGTKKRYNIKISNKKSEGDNKIKCNKREETCQRNTMIYTKLKSVSVYTYKKSLENKNNFILWVLKPLNNFIVWLITLKFNNLMVQ